MTSFIRRSPLALLSFLGALFFVLVAVSRAASPYVIDVWTPYQGLPQSRVLSIAQTPDGYLWVGTKLGWLARFEGIRFTSFGPENTPALGSPEIHKLLVDDAALPFGVRVKEILNGFSAPIEKVDTEAFKDALDEFIIDLDELEEK